MATHAPDLLWTQAPAGGHRVVAQAGEACTLGVSGSAGAGRWLRQGGADHVDKASSELEGNASFIVLDGVDLDIAVDRAGVRPERSVLDP